MVFFPLVGLFLGVILALSSNLLANILPNLLISIVIILLLAVLTGGLHLDGLADTIDAFYAGRDKDEILEIMRDSHIGTMGVIGLIGLLLLKIGFLEAISFKFIPLLIMPVLSRWSMALAIFLFNYVREEGKAKHFFLTMNWKKFLLVTLITLIITYFTFGFNRISLTLIFIVISSTVIFCQWVKGKINGITGDTLGAINEINELLILVVIYIGG